MMLLACVAVSRRSRWALEQPATSLMTRMPVIRKFRRLPRGILGGPYRQVMTDMGAFAAPTKKPSKLFTFGSWLKPLKKSIGPNFTARAVTCVKTASGAVTGTRELKVTQEYTREFGEAVFSAWGSARLGATALFDKEDEADSDWESCKGPECKIFNDASLNAIAKKLKVPEHKLIFL